MSGSAERWWNRRAGGKSDKPNVRFLKGNLGAAAPRKREVMEGRSRRGDGC